MSDLRQKFEALPEFKCLLENCEWCEEDSAYSNNTGDIDLDYQADACSGGFTAFCIRQKEIDQLKVQLSLQRDRNKALEAELTISRNYGDQLKAEKAGLLKAIDDEVKRCVESANAPIRDDHDKGWRNAMLSVRDGFERLRCEHE